jgi:mitochondrial translocator assembly and maintenance protein 41
VIDLIFVVDSAEEFHKSNFDRNYSHYGGFSKRLPLSVTYDGVQRSGSRLYFNPLIPLKSFEGFEGDQRRLKYGVI